MEKIPQTPLETDPKKRLTTKEDVEAEARLHGWDAESTELEDFCLAELTKMFREGLLERDMKATDMKIRMNIPELIKHLEKWNGDFVYSQSEMPIGSLYLWASQDTVTFQNQVKDFVHHMAGIQEW